MSRILRSLVCLLLICCILVNLSPLKAQATGAGAVAGGIVKAASVSIPGLWPIVACLAVVGITAYGIESGAFENIANSCYSAFESAGTWVNNGLADILRTEDADGNVQYYVDGGMLEDVRDWSVSSNIVSLVGLGENTVSLWQSINIDYSITPYSISRTYIQSGTLYYEYAVSSSPFVLRSDGYYWTEDESRYVGYKLWTGCTSIVSSSSARFAEASECSIPGVIPSIAIQRPTTSENISLGYFPSAEIDEVTVVTFHPYLPYVIRTRTGGSGGSGEDENKWWLAVAYAETLEKLYQTSQQAQIENPSVTEIPDIQVGIEYDVTEEEDEEGKKQYYLDPIQTPGTGTDPGTGDGTDTDPDTGTDSGNGSGDNTGTDSGSTGNTGSSWTPPSDHSQFALADLSKFFPFCIPFDLFDFFKLLYADPVAPSFTWEIQDLSGQTYGLTVDLSQWDSVAQLFRRLQLFLFVCGLAAASRKYIKW